MPSIHEIQKIIQEKRDLTPLSYAQTRLEAAKKMVPAKPGAKIGLREVTLLNAKAAISEIPFGNPIAGRLHYHITRELNETGGIDQQKVANDTAHKP